MDSASSLEGRYLIAMPTIRDGEFDRTLVYMCVHGEHGSMGFVVNKPMPGIDFNRVLEELGLDTSVTESSIIIHRGGPVAQGRGFVLHSDDYMNESSVPVSKGIALTATTDVIVALAGGDGPKKSFLAMGYAGWGPGQLDAEILANGWIVCEADHDLIFSSSYDDKWQDALQRIGIDPAMLVMPSGDISKPN